MFTVEFPYDIGTLVQVNDGSNEPPKPKTCFDDLGDIGTILCYSHVTTTRFDVIISGYKQPWWGHYSLSRIRALTDIEVQQVKQSLSTKEEE